MLPLLAAAALAASDPAPDALEHHVTAGAHAFQYPLLYAGIPVRLGPSVGYAVRLPVGLEAGVAARLVAPAAAEPSWAFEGAVHLDVVGAIGRWRPAAGIELGASTRTRSEVLESERPPGSYFADLGAPEPLWVDVTATPARFRVGAWEIGAARLGVGVSLPHLGMAGRWRADLLTVSRVL
ncbi:MAG: hypothetical protein ACK4YP_02120 [Myxococcota bacterium]